MPNKIQTLCAACCAALLLTPIRSTLIAQTQPEQNLVRAPQMSDKPFTIPSLGLTLRLPQDAILDMSPPNLGATGIGIWPQDESEGWRIMVFSSITSDRAQNPKTVLDALISSYESLYPLNDPNHKARPGTKPLTLVRTIQRENNLVVGSSNLPTSRAYVDIPAIEEEPARGYTVFQTDRGQFVVFQLQAPQKSFASARVTYETLITLAEFRDPTELNAERGAPLLAGAAFLDSLNKADYDEAAKERTTFFRLYAPASSSASSSAKEIAWQRVHITMGQLGDLNPDRDKTTWGQSEREFGYLVSIDARAKIDDKTLDTQGRFFLSRDKSTERWSVRTEAIQDNRVLDHQTQTVVRNDKRLTIRTENPGSQPSTADYRIPDKGYISRVEAYLLPSLISAKNIPGAFAFYNYDPQFNKLTLRRETFTPRDGGKGWLQTTRLTEDAASHETILDARGNILRQTLPTGVVMEPADRDQLLSLWREENLPTSR